LKPDPISKIPNTKSADGMAQGEGSEFNPPMLQKKKKRKKKGRVWGLGVLLSARVFICLTCKSLRFNLQHHIKGEFVFDN
jgi:hypothetical protein